MSISTPTRVSILITNFNYARFLLGAVESVKAQTYPHIECIIVDDCSTDESESVIATIKERWSDIACFRTPHNVGQSAATLLGLAHVGGSYVVLLDADDLLLPECVATHLSAHFSSRRAVGLTCADSLQLLNEDLVSGRNASISQSFLELELQPELLSDSVFEPLSDQAMDLPRLSAEAVRHVPWNRPDWSWSTTSCMMFRKDALDLVCGARGLASVRSGTDNYLAHIVNLWTGSLVLDRQLVKYRVHESNDFARRVSIDGVSAFDRDNSHYHETLRVFLDDLDQRFEDMFKLIDHPARFVGMCAFINYIERYVIVGGRQTVRLTNILKVRRSEWIESAGPALLDDMLFAASTENPCRYLSVIMKEPPDIVRLSKSEINAIAMEVWFERQRWGLPYKMRKRLAHHWRQLAAYVQS